MSLPIKSCSELMNQYYNEGKFVPHQKEMRGWKNRLKNTHKFISYLLDNNILAKWEAARFESVSYSYYRYYNDGDFPKCLSRRKISKDDNTYIIAGELEEYLSDFYLTIVKKYWNKVDRKKALEN